MHAILLPLDGSALAESARPLATSLAARTGAILILAAVYDPRGAVLGVLGGMGERRWDMEAKATLRGALAAAQARVAQQAPTLATEVAVLDGVPADALAAYAATTGVDLIVLTTHGLGGVSRLWLGSVTDALVRQTRIPVLVVHASARGANTPNGADAIHRVLVPLDANVESEAVLQTAITVAGTVGVRYTLLRVAAPLHPALESYAFDAEIERDIIAQQARAQRALDEIAVRLRERGVDVTTAVRLDNQPARAILAFATESEADLIAIATHGLGRLSRFLLGSVADKVLRGATMPVLVQHLAAGN